MASSYSGTVNPALDEAINDQVDNVSTAKRPAAAKTIVGKNVYAVPPYAANMYFCHPRRSI